MRDFSFLPKEENALIAEIKEGDLYKTFELDGIRFDIYYGYEDESERHFGELSPVYPDFIAKPQYTKDGYPFAVAYQMECEHYAPKRNSDDDWCANCKFYDKREEYMGVCRCEKRKRKNDGNAGP